MRRVSRLVPQICEALQFEHESGVVHRDVKPENLVLTDASGQRTMKVLDFGIAKLLADESEGEDRTRTGERLMTPEYAAPEQLLGRSADARSDQFSLGMVLFEALTGRRPFKLEGLSPREIEDLIAYVLSL